MEYDENVPRHVAVIMDGNRRWAKQRLLPSGAGHRAGLKRMIALAEHLFARGVRYVTMYALSTENLSRTPEELEGLFSLFRDYFGQNVQRLEKAGIRLLVIGDMSLLPPDIRELIREGVRTTEGGRRGTLTLAIAYGARQEILCAVNRAVREGKEVDAESFTRLLYTGEAELPEPDLLIRTGKELRLSNFLLWQCAYTEFYFSDKLFPAFTDRDADKALLSYAGRERRYGKS